MMGEIGTSDFARGLLDAMQSGLPCSHCTVLALEDIGTVSTVSAASQHGDVAEATAHLYIDREFYRRDANMRWLAAKKTPVREQVWILHQVADDIGDADYRRLCYVENGIRERLSLIYLLVDGRRMCVGFYRNLSLVPFAPTDLEFLGNVAPLIGAALKAHIRVTRRHLRGSLLHEKIFAKLSSRERQVISHVLSGRTTKEAAVLLGLSTTTVLTYRYRAFRSLGIRSHHDLLALLDRSPATF
jgi:DNA-binding CsgD family transcriptional regulator